MTTSPALRRERLTGYRMEQWQFTRTTPLFHPAPGATEQLAVQAPGHRQGPADGRPDSHDGIDQDPWGFDGPISGR
jgi:hypothetical protein